MPDEQDNVLQRELQEYGWKQVQGKLGAPAKLQMEEAVNAWLEGRLSMEDAAATVRSIVPVDPAKLPLNPRTARVVDGRLYRRSGKRWVASDGSVLAPEE